MLWNDSGLGDIPLTLNLVAMPNPVTEGTVSLNNDGSFTFAPVGDYNGATSFSYTITDSGALPGETSDTSATVVVDLTVVAVNDPPVAVDDSAALDEDASVNIDVILNDSDVDGTIDPTTVVVTSGPSYGTATENIDGTVDYTPDADFNGTDSFTYYASDGTDDSNIATVTITVNSVNDVPIAQDDAATTNEDTPVTIDVLANDPMGNNPPPAPGDGLGSLVPSEIPGVTQGTVSEVGNQIEYTPPSDWSGVDTFTYEVCDADPTPDCDTATVTVTVDAVNDPPVAAGDSYSVDEDTVLDVPAPGVLSNDYDVDGDPFTPNLVSNVSNGALLFGADGSFTYTPDNNFNGTDTFTYEVCDPSSACSSANVTIVVNPVPDPQVFISVSPSDVTLDPNDVFTFDLLFGNRGPGTAFGIVISGAVTGECNLLTPNPIFTSSSMAEGDGFITTADVQANASGAACVFTATITSTNGTTDSGSADITIYTSSPSVALLTSGSFITGMNSILSPIPPQDMPTPDATALPPMGGVQGGGMATPTATVLVGASRVSPPTTAPVFTPTLPIFTPTPDPGPAFGPLSVPFTVNFTPTATLFLTPIPPTTSQPLPSPSSTAPPQGTVAPEMTPTPEQNGPAPLANTSPSPMPFGTSTPMPSVYPTDTPVPPTQPPPPADTSMPSSPPANTPVPPPPPPDTLVSPPPPPDTPVPPPPAPGVTPPS